MQHPIDLGAFALPILVTVVYFGLWYALLFGLQSRTKYRLRDEYAAREQAFDRYFGQDRRMLAADRIVMNTHEQMGPFLVAMWLHAVFVSPLVAGILGGVYVVLRSIYPFLIGRQLGNTQSKRVFFVTGPCYLLVGYMLSSTAIAALGTHW